MKYRTFRVRITRIGWLFLLLTVGVGVSALNTGNNLLYLIFAMMLSFLILSMLLSNNTLQKLAIRPHYPHRIFANQAVGIRLDVENQKKRFPSFALSLISSQSRPGEADRPFIIKIPPQRSVSALEQVIFPERGIRPLPQYVLETAYPFGLIEKYLGLDSEGTTLVYPAIIPIETLWQTDQRHHGEFLSGTKGESANPYGIREFIYGDSARLIHWKSSARQGSWKVKEFEKEKKLRIHLDVWLRPASQSEKTLLERAISAAATLLLELSERGYEITLGINGDSIEPRGRGYIDAYLSALAVASPPDQVAPSSSAAASDARILLTDFSVNEVRAPSDYVFAKEQLEKL